MPENNPQNVFFVDDDLIGRLDEAVKELEAAAARGDSPKEVYFGLGHLHFEQQQWEEAATCYAKAAEADPAYLPAHYDRGLSLERSGKFEEAEKSFAAAVELDPKRWQAQTGRGMCLLQLGKPEEAL